MVLNTSRYMDWNVTNCSCNYCMKMFLGIMVHGRKTKQNLTKEL
jgi:hypothetical protein